MLAGLPQFAAKSFTRRSSVVQLRRSIDYHLAKPIFGLAAHQHSTSPPRYTGISNPGHPQPSTRQYNCRTSILHDHFSAFRHNFLYRKRFRSTKSMALEQAADAGGDASASKNAQFIPNTSVELAEPPEYIAKRLKMWNALKEEYARDLMNKDVKPIKVTLPDGKEIPGEAWRTTPFSIAEGISKGLAEAAVISKVNGELWDLDRPLEGDCQLQLLKFDDPEAKAVFWHSSAHVLGECMERFYGGWLCYGPPIDEGFYYDIFMQDQRSVSNEDFAKLDVIKDQAIKEKQPFERLEMTKEQLLKMFEYNPFKQRIINEKIDTPTTTVYRCGPLIDLCRGPHVRHTGKIKAMQITKNSSSYWEGNAAKESLQRIYGISFPDAKQLKEWQKFQEEASKRDHRKIGREQELFFFHELSPGCALFYPKGAHIYNTLIDFIKSEYRKRGFEEVITPNVYNSKLWKTSGHWDHYADHMFQIDCEGEKFALKPMNCPGHCLMFASRSRSWRELPLRMADFGVLHRNELSGTLTGLTRVRRFAQDDAHIFCTQDQIGEEIRGCLDFLKKVYDTLGFTFKLYLSTRPKKFLGEKEVWDNAENMLRNALDEFNHTPRWELNEGDGAFYGPKIDIQVMDALRRSHQCATIQLDFQLPIRFDLSYVLGEQEKQRPVIIHRAVLGSVERMMAILTESFGGKWPFWLSPRQACVVPVNNVFDDYAREVQQQLHAAGFMCDGDVDHGATLNKKIRNAQLAQYNFILVVGEKEKDNKSVNVRTRDNKVHGEMTTQQLVEKFNGLRDSRALNSEEF